MVNFIFMKIFKGDKGLLLNFSSIYDYFHKCHVSRVISHKHMIQNGLVGRLKLELCNAIDLIDTFAFTSSYPVSFKVI